MERQLLINCTQGNRDPAAAGDDPARDEQADEGCDILADVLATATSD